MKQLGLYIAKVSFLYCNHYEVLTSSLTPVHAPGTVVFFCVDKVTFMQVQAVHFLASQGWSILPKLCHCTENGYPCILQLLWISVEKLFNPSGAKSANELYNTVG